MQRIVTKATNIIVLTSQGHRGIINVRQLYYYYGHYDLTAIYVAIMAYAHYVIVCEK